MHDWVYPNQPCPGHRAHRWLIGGRVQGVGFRPFVLLLATELGVNGSVRNAGGHVEVVAQHNPTVTDLFLRRLLSEHPAIARPELVSVEPCGPVAHPCFQILPSQPGTEAVLLPDQTVCDSCLAEMADPNARRYRYPLITCTQCGPRFTILREMPFDRASTSLAGFPLCSGCEHEYNDPLDRRFHAQVMACAACGPMLRYRCGPEIIDGNEAAMSRTVLALREGAIVAVKGIGGYHLICDATDDAVVSRLRARKGRPAKPLAVLFPRTGADGLDTLRAHCAPNLEEALTLTAPSRPIVLVTLRDGSALSPFLAPGLKELGALLPCSPLHDLIASAFSGPLVATSGNVSGEPVLTEPAQAEKHLAAVADGFLHHDRPILRPADDGVVRVIACQPRLLRLGRGSSPLELTLRQPVASPILALGGQTKVTLALAFGSRVIISPHLGDMGAARGMDLLETTAETFQRLHGVKARTLVCDLHGGFNSTRWAEASNDLPVLRIPHYHAHAAAVAGEFSDEPNWLCFTWDGVGLGADGTLWGGEALLGQPGAWERVATFRPFAPLGGEIAAREPWRSAAALAWELGVDWTPPVTDVALARAAWTRRINCPPTSAAGRLFDAASAFLNLVHYARYESEGPMTLEARADPRTVDHVPLPLPRRPDGVWQADWAPLVPMLLDATRSVPDRAAVFHNTLAQTLVEQAIAVRRVKGAFAVGLAGGVFQNRRLSEVALDGLRNAGFRAYLPVVMPCNDAGLSFGQIIEASARMATQS
jgi:hydrogenase maturation protein HypF